MTTHDDLETRLRTSLRDRADDVETTPALYERVQRQATRGTWVRRGFALAGAAAVVAAAVAIAPSLLPDGPLEPDIAETPEDVATPTPTPEPIPSPTPGATSADFATAMAQAGLVWSDGSTIHIGDQEVPATAFVEDGVADGGATVRATALAVEPGIADDRFVAAVVRADGGATSIGWARAGTTSSAAAGATPNGDGITFVPGDMATVAWIDGTDLHLRSLDGVFDERVQPLAGDVPAGLVAQQWVAQADAQVLLATDPAGGVWSLPMDDSNAANTGPTDAGFLLPQGDDAVDTLLRPDLARVDLVAADAGGPARLRSAGADPVSLPAGLAASTSPRLVGNGSWTVTVDDPASGSGALLHLTDTGEIVTLHTWADRDVAVTAVAPFVVADAPAGTAGDGRGDGSAADALGLRTDAPMVGTAGTDLLVRTADGQVRTLPLYLQPESEAALGRLAVRPGSSVDDGLVAVESFSEGENSIRFARLQAGEVTPVGDVIVVPDPVTGLVWSEDGTRLAWTDAAGLHIAAVEGMGAVAGSGELVSDDTRPVLDWVWDDIDGSAATGHVTLAVAGGTGVELVGVDRTSDGRVTVVGVAGGSDRLAFDTHATPGAAVGPVVNAAIGGGTAVLRWSADGDQFGDLADPGVVGGDVRVQVSGGHVIVMGDSRQVLVTFDGEVVDLPTAADWDVLD